MNRLLFLFLVFPSIFFADFCTFLFSEIFFYGKTICYVIHIFFYVRLLFPQFMGSCFQKKNFDKWYFVFKIIFSQLMWDYQGMGFFFLQVFQFPSFILSTNIKKVSHCFPFFFFFFFQIFIYKFICVSYFHGF